MFKIWRIRLVGVAVLPKRAPVRKLPLSKVASLAILSRRLVPLALPTSFAFVLVHLGKLQSSIFKSCLLGLEFHIFISIQISNSYQLPFPGPPPRRPIQGIVIRSQCTCLKTGFLQPHPQDLSFSIEIALFCFVHSGLQTQQKCTRKAAMMRGGKVQYRRVNSQVGTPLVGKTRRSETLGASSSHEGYLSLIHISEPTRP